MHLRHLALALLGFVACQDASTDDNDHPPADSGSWGDMAADGTSTTDPLVTTLPTGGGETCLWVQGGADRVRAPARGTPTGQAPQTVEAWIRTASLAPQVAVSHGLASPGRAFYLGTDEGYAMFSTGGLEHVDEGAFVADGAWHHLALVFDGETATLWVDGVRGLSEVLDEVDIAEGEVVAGAAPATGGYAWVGWIDDVRIFLRQRTAGDLADPYAVDERGLALWWDFEVEGSGPGVTVPDLSGGGTDGTTGGTEGTPSFLPCR